MTQFWVPELVPPLVSEEGFDKLTSSLLDQGVIPTASTGITLIRTEHRPLADYLDDLSFDLNAQVDDGIWPERLLKIGAGLGMLAYGESGYGNTVDELAVEIGKFTARMEDVPTAYLTSLVQDPALIKLVGIIAETPDFRSPGEGYYQVLSIGCGVSRHYMQQAIAA